MTQEKIAKIRIAKKADIEAICQIGKKAPELSFSKEMSFHDKSEFVEFVKHPKENILLVAEVKGQIVGFVYAKIMSKTWCLLDSLAIKKQYQNQGIGTQLLEETYKILKKNKVTYIQILEQINKKKTRLFWKKQGFKEKQAFIWADKNL